MTNVQANGSDANAAEDDRIIAFLFTDIEGSTGHAQHFPEGMRSAHARHDEIIRKAGETFGGDLFQAVGDGFKAAFPDPAAAVRAAFEAQRALQTVYIDDDGTILLRVRMAIHAGLTQERDGEYIGLTPAKASRLVETIYGGQIVLTGDTAEMVRVQLPDGAALQDIGEFKLRDFEVPDRLFQIAHPDLPANFPPLRPTDAVPNNLPNQLSHLIGRETETEDIRQRVFTFPLVTLTGAGGCGKTRLALHVADRFLRKFRDGVWFIDLTHSDDAESIARTTADVLGIKPDADSPLVRQIVAHLKPLKCLLILDNCELIIDAAAGFAAELLKSCKDVRILATSRESLGINGEALYPVHPLPYPPETLRDPKALMTFDSVRQFALQARLKSPTFRLTAENVFPVARICRRVDGIPLGVYLMASWSDTLTPAQMDAQMEKRFKFPKAAPGERTLPARHLTVRATIEYSLDLLTESERTLLRRLAIFSGGFTLDTAEAICDGDPIEDVLESLTRLLRKSLIESDDAPFGKRYRLLHPIREFALEILHEYNEHDALRARHRDYFVEWADEIGPELTEPSKSRQALLRTDVEMDNLRAALSAASHTTMGFHLIFSLSWYWHLRGYVREGITWAERFLPLDVHSPIDNSALRADVRYRVGILYLDEGDSAKARQCFMEALALYRISGTDPGVAKSLINLGNIAFSQKDFAEAVRFLSEGVEVSQRTESATNSASALSSLGIALYNTGATEAGVAKLHQALATQRQMGLPQSVANTLFNLSAIASRTKDWDTAYVYLDESLALWQELQYHSGIADCLDQFAQIAEGKADTMLSAHLLGFADAFRSGADTVRRPPDVEEMNALRQRLINILGIAVFSQEVNQGAAENLGWALEKAVRFKSELGGESDQKS